MKTEVFNIWRFSDIIVLLKFNQYQISNRMVYNIFWFEKKYFLLCWRWVQLQKSAIMATKVKNFGGPKA